MAPDRDTLSIQPWEIADAAAGVAEIGGAVFFRGPGSLTKNGRNRAKDLSECLISGFGR
jgi:hypothetical protein